MLLDSKIQVSSFLSIDCVYINFCLSPNYFVQNNKLSHILQQDEKSYNFEARPQGEEIGVDCLRLKDENCRKRVRPFLFASIV